MRLQHERGKNPHPDALISGRRRNSSAGLSQPPSSPELLRATASTRPRTPWPGARHRRRFAAERGTQESARYHERQDRDREHHHVVHPPHPVLSIGRSLPNRPRPPTNSLPESLAARLAWRRSAVAPWLCVTAFRRLCSWQRFAFSRVHGSARGPVERQPTHRDSAGRARSSRKCKCVSCLYHFPRPRPSVESGTASRNLFARCGYKVRACRDCWRGGASPRWDRGMRGPATIAPAPAADASRTDGDGVRPSRRSLNQPPSAG